MRRHGGAFRARVPASGACRLCGGDLSSRPLLVYRDMPQAAQHLPDKRQLHADTPVTLDLRQCPACGLVQLKAKPVPYYREVIRATGLSEEMTAFRITQLRAFVHAHSLSGQRALEVGCGRGEYLALLQHAGLDAHGIEYAPEAVSHCQAQGLKASRAFLDKASPRLPEGPFKAFFMFSFLEHLPNPGGMLRAIAGNLEEGAVGLVEVPNLDMILEKDLFSEFISDHLCYFTQATLTAALTLNGFEVLACTEVWHRYILSATIRKRSLLDLARFQVRQDHLRRTLHQCLDQVPSGRVAVWGAGHQALALLALADLGKRIRYVVDSAPFKQGRFTPATHLPIVPPSTLASDPVEAVIVMAASYSDEVARILRRDYSRHLKVWILRDSGLEPA